MEMVRIKFANDDDRVRGGVGLAKIMKIVVLRGGYYVVPAKALEILDEWGCQ